MSKLKAIANGIIFVFLLVFISFEVWTLAAYLIKTYL
jgi:hypothetical protein